MKGIPMCEELKYMKTSMRKCRQRIGAAAYEDKMFALSAQAKKIVYLIELGASLEKIIEALVVQFQRGLSSAITPAERRTALCVFMHEIENIREVFDA